MRPPRRGGPTNFGIVRGFLDAPIFQLHVQEYFDKMKIVWRMSICGKAVEREFRRQAGGMDDDKKEPKHEHDNS